MTINTDVIDELLKHYKTPEEILGENGLPKQLTRPVFQLALHAEITLHLGHKKHAAVSNKSSSSRNGSSAKTIKGDFGTMPIEIPRDRESSFEPVLIPKGQTRFVCFDDKIMSFYSRGLTTREIQGHLEEIYGVEVSPTLIS
jgi:putative transposase